MPTGEASAETNSSFDGSKCTRSGDELRSSFDLEKAVCWSVAHFHGVPFFNNLYRGERRDDKLGKNLL